MVLENKNINKITDQIIGFAIEVHKAMGPGLLESAYEQCLSHEFSLRGIAFKRQHPLPVVFKGTKLACGYRADFIVENSVLLEIKAVDVLLPIHEAQLLTYMKLGKLNVGLLVNFNVATFKRGIKRFVLEVGSNGNIKEYLRALRG